MSERGKRKAATRGRGSHQHSSVPSNSQQANEMPPKRRKVTNTSSNNQQAENLILNAILLGYPQRPFQVPVAPSTSVYAWVKEAQKEIKGLIGDVATVSLVAWKLRTPIPAEMIEDELSKPENNVSTLCDIKMDSLTAIGYYFDDVPLEKHLHIIVDIKAIIPAQQKLKTEVDILAILLARWSDPIEALNMAVLLNHLHKPLAEEEKVPISQKEFDSLIFPSFVGFLDAALTAEELATMFRVSDIETAGDVPDIIKTTIKRSPPTDGTEAAFISTWDRNISDILQLVISSGEFIRNSDLHTSTDIKKPNYGFLIDNHCIVRGEEKGPNSKGNPKAELLEKLVYTYEPLPYIIGYYAVGSEVHFVAITSARQIEPLFSYNLQRKRERVANVVKLIRLCGAISWMSGQLAAREQPEFQTFKRSDELTEITIGTVIKKQFSTKNVPNVDALKKYSQMPGKFYVITAPVGIPHRPATGTQAFNAVVCVLEALKVMHSEPDPIYHRDIREPNIIKRHDRDEWFLIDWCDATTTPTRAATHLSKQEHSPAVRQDNHGAEVDIWGVGYYLKHLVAHIRPIRGGAIREMALRWMGDSTVTAEMALNDIEQSRDLFFVADTA